MTASHSLSCRTHDGSRSAGVAARRGPAFRLSALELAKAALGRSRKWLLATGKQAGKCAAIGCTDHNHNVRLERGVLPPGTSEKMVFD